MSSKTPPPSFLELQFQQRSSKKESKKALLDEGISPFWAKIFAQRNIENSKQIKQQLKDLSPPWGMAGLEPALALLLEAYEKKETLGILGDYDVDGATATALLVKNFQKMGFKVEYYIPNRIKDGYGLTAKTANIMKEKGTELLITVDSGITAHEGSKEVLKLGMKLIITDHHQVGETLPEANAIINPKRKDCLFPDKNIAGVAVAFYLASALYRHLEKSKGCSFPFSVLDSLDYVAFGTVADMVPLDESNRRLAALGIERIRAKKASIGILALISSIESTYRSAVFETLSSEDISFSLAPILNAAGRMSDMSKGVALLLTEDEKTAKELLLELLEFNRARKIKEQEAYRKAIALMEVENQRILVLHDPSFHAGVVGIVASRLKNQYKRSALVLYQNKEDSWSGSMRSAGRLHAKEFLDELNHKAPLLLSHYGGHPKAAGMTLKKGVSPLLFAEEVLKLCQEKEEETFFETTVFHDGILLEKDFHQNLYQEIKAKIPWGSGFESPTFCNQVKILSAGAFGKKGSVGGKNHLNLTILDEENWQKERTAIWFGAISSPGVCPKEGEIWSIIYSLGEGFSGLKLFIKEGKRCLDFEEKMKNHKLGEIKE